MRARGHTMIVFVEAHVERTRKGGRMLNCPLGKDAGITQAAHKEQTERHHSIPRDEHSLILRPLGNLVELFAIFQSASVVGTYRAFPGQLPKSTQLKRPVA